MNTPRTWRTASAFVALTLAVAALIAVNLQARADDDEGPVVIETVEEPMPAPAPTGHLGAPGLPGADTPDEEFPGQAAYKESLKRAERQYIEQVMRARKAYVRAIKDFQMRASMLPEAAQRLDAEIKRIEDLPRPRVEPEPQAAASEVSISLQTPSPLWSIALKEARLVDGQICVLWQLKQQQGMGAMVISTATAKAMLNTTGIPADAAVRHYIMGKRWNWEDKGLKATFVDSEKDLGKKWTTARVIEPVKDQKPAKKRGD